MRKLIVISQFIYIGTTPIKIFIWWNIEGVWEIKLIECVEYIYKFFAIALYFMSLSSNVWHIFDYLRKWLYLGNIDHIQYSLYVLYKISARSQSVVSLLVRCKQFKNDIYSHNWFWGWNCLHSCYNRISYFYEFNTSVWGVK